jgi:hypothetical protein
MLQVIVPDLPALFSQEFGPQPSQRIATVLVYLSDVEEGGEALNWQYVQQAAGSAASSKQGDRAVANKQSRAAV